jgi:hypothetical protein
MVEKVRVSELGFFSSAGVNPNPPVRQAYGPPLGALETEGHVVKITWSGNRLWEAPSLKPTPASTVTPRPALGTCGSCSHREGERQLERVIANVGTIVRGADVLAPRRDTSWREAAVRGFVHNKTTSQNRETPP